MRIIAGKFKGMVLNTFDAENIRPTADRVRESIFNKIQFLVKDAVVLDLFGGTGAMSLEFVSRGAKTVITCDNNKSSEKLIKSNFAKAKTNPKLLMGNYWDLLDGMNNKFDIIFLDPPFATDFGEKAIDKIIEKDLIDPNGLIIFEHSIDKNIEYSSKVELVDTKKYGTIVVDYLQVRDDKGY